MTSTTRYLEPGIKRMLFQCSFDVVRYDAEMENGTSKASYPSPHCDFHSVRIFLLGTDVADYATVCDLGALGDFVPVD